MIIDCEKCHTKFRLDESLLKETGSKVRCSICKYKFILFPPKTEPQIKVELPEKPEVHKAEPPGEAPTDKESAPDLDKTLIGEVIEVHKAEPPGEAPTDKESAPDLDTTIEQEIEEGIGQQEEDIEPVSFEELSLLDSGVIKRGGEEKIDIEEALDRATKLEEEIVSQHELKREKTEEILRYKYT